MYRHTLSAASQDTQRSLHFPCEASVVFPALSELCSNTSLWGKALVCSPRIEGARGICKAATDPLWLSFYPSVAILVQGYCEGSSAKGSPINCQIPSFVCSGLFPFKLISKLGGHKKPSQGHSSAF